MIFLVACTLSHKDTFVEKVEDSGVTELPFLLDFPLLEREKFQQRVGVDHDREEQEGILGRLECTDYQGRAFPHCYDQHEGSDFILSGGFSAMDSGSAHIIAAASGEVTLAQDGNYDRCHGSIESADVTCDGHPIRANAVIIAHPEGFQTLYWHMMKDSVVVSVGDYVERGDVLGKVGSSGYSSMPHLHFELQDTQENIIDPYAGEYSQEESYWCDQDDPLPRPCD